MNKNQFKASLAIRGLTQDAAAKLVGVNHSTISEILNGKRTPSLDTVNSIASALKLSNQEIIDIFFENELS